jgi:protein-arginine kinase activator protein McsA
MLFEMDDHEDQRQILCERCRKFAPIDMVKYVAKGNEAKMALCTKCLKNFNPPGTQIKKASEQGELKSYTCEKCKYNFKFNTAKNAQLRCPYCGRADRIVDASTRSAGAILKESF